MNKELRAQLAEIARKEVGTVEVGGNNRGPRIVEYQKATWLKPGAWAWCMAFVCWCIRELADRNSMAGKFVDVPTLATPVPKPSPVLDFDRPRTASALGDHDVTFWAREEGLKVLSPQAPIEEGDIAVYKWGHVGIVVGEAPSLTYFLSTEGNTGKEGNTRDTQSDGVWTRTRFRKDVLHFIRLEKE